jgi:putative transposase
MSVTDEAGEAVVAGAGVDGDPAMVRRPVVDEGFLDELMARVQAEGLELTGPGGLLNQLTRQVLERALEEEMTDHLGYERGDRSGQGSGNSRNGFAGKTLTTEIGPVPVEVPRDRNGSFDPVIVPKGARRVGGLSDMVISLFAKGMTVRDIADHLDEIYGTKISHETVANITDAVAEEIRAWQHRPLDAIWPVLFIDAIVVKIRDGGVVRNKAAHLALGVDLDGNRHVLGVWLQQSEGAKFWLSVLTELRNRGVGDVFIVCADGLTGIREAIEATWPQATLQTCVVHLIRNSMRYVSYTDRKSVAAALRPIYTAATVEAAQLEFDAFAAGDLGRRHPGIVAVWRRAWEEFTPFLAFPIDIRRYVYTTNAIESLNFQLRKVTRNRGHFPTDDAATKLLWLAIRDIEARRNGDRGRPYRKVPVEHGRPSHGWKQVLNAFAIHYADRMPK